MKNGALYKAWRCYAAANYGLPKERMGELVGCSNSSINEKALLASMRFLITHIKLNYKSLRAEIISEIKSLHSFSVQETAQIRNQMDALKEKKKKMIDLVLDGTLSKADLTEQMGWYEEQMRELERSLEISQQNDRIRDMQTTEQEAYITALDGILSFDEDNQELYRTVLEKMVITGNVVDVYLGCLPFAVRLTVRSSGRNETYTTEIVKMELLNIQ